MIHIQCSPTEMYNPVLLPDMFVDKVHTGDNELFPSFVTGSLPVSLVFNKDYS